MKEPRVCILKADGTNCDSETRFAFAFDMVGGNTEVVHVNQLRSGAKKLHHYHILVIPGGFSYGDDVVSGKVLAVELLSFLRDQLQEFIASGKLIMGICNGFQVLVRTGLLPRQSLGHMYATLTSNDSGRFQCSWIQVAIQPSPCVYTQGLEGNVITLQMAHGEGKYLTTSAILQATEADQLVVLRYLENPNGSMNGIAGVCDPSGRIFGLMPHPERYVLPHQYENWRRTSHTKPHGLPIFENAVTFAAENLC